MKISGIYKIVNRINNKCYIGSSKHIHNRWYQHKHHLLNNKHHSLHLQSAWNLYHETNFYLEIIEECKLEELSSRENYYFDLLKPEYNIAKIAYSLVGVKHSKETSEKHRVWAKSNDWQPPKEYSISKRRPVDKVDYETLKIIEKFESINAALKSIDKDVKFNSTISHVCDGIKQSAFGYRWKWRDAELPIVEGKSSLLTNSEKQFIFDNYPTMNKSEIGRKLNRHPSAIGRILKQNRQLIQTSA